MESGFADLPWNALFPVTWDPVKAWDVYSSPKLTSIMDHNVPTFKTQNWGEMERIKDKHSDKMCQFCSLSK